MDDYPLHGPTGPLAPREKAICYSINLQLCDALGIKKDPHIIDNLGTYICPYGQIIGEKDPKWRSKTFKRLYKKYGKGAVVLAFASAQDFADGKCMKLSLNPKYVPKDCCFESGAYYATEIMLKLVGAQYPILTDEQYKEKFILLYVIYSNWPKETLFRSWHSVSFSCNKLEKFFQRKRWSATLLRKQYSIYLYLFTSDHSNAGSLLQIIRKALNLNYKSLREAIKDWFPFSIVDYIQNRNGRLCVEGIINDLLMQCDEHNDEWREWSKYINVTTMHLRSGRTKVILFGNRFPFITRAFKEIMRFVDMRLISFAFFKEMEERVRWKKCVDLRHLIGKIEGRKCTFYYCSNQESRENGVIERYKICSSCRNAFYCSRSCQKKDWAIRHKVLCKSSRYYTYFHLDSNYFV